jgi:hypothetical protein
MSSGLYQRKKLTGFGALTFATAATSQNSIHYGMQAMSLGCKRTAQKFWLIKVRNGSKADASGSNPAP